MCKKAFPERRKNMCKSMEAWRHGSSREIVSKTEWLEPREAETGGRGQIMYYLVHCAKSHESPSGIPLSPRSIYNWQLTTSPICKT